MNTYHSVYILVLFSTNFFFLYHLEWGKNKSYLFLQETCYCVKSQPPFQRSHWCIGERLQNLDLFLATRYGFTIFTESVTNRDLSENPGLSNNSVFFTMQTLNPRLKSIQYLQKCNWLRTALTRVALCMV